MQEIAEGDGPKGNFDNAHLKAIHGYIFQDVYGWASHTPNESPVVEGQRVEPIGGLSKGGTSFLPGSRIEMGLDEALKPIRDPQALRNATPEEFAERAGKVLELCASIQRGKRTCPGSVYFRAGPPLRPRNRLLCNHQAAHDRGVDRDHKRPVQSRDEACD